MMVTISQFRKFALSFPGANEQPHFEKISFRIGKKIFATFDKTDKRACLKLSEMDQDLFGCFDNNIFYPVANKWGKQGWTFVEMNKVRVDMFKDALTAAYCEVAPKENVRIFKSREISRQPRKMNNGRS
jgi:predicted DNA-binding protein (MmcQ/YjbR family)